MRKNKNKLALKEEVSEEPEKYFFKYAFPCAQSKLYSGSLNVEDYKMLNNLFLQGKCPDKQTLERIFPAAFFRLEQLAKKMDKDKWDLEVIKEYWTKEHNKIVERGDGMYIWETEESKDLCKINEARVIKIEGDKLIVKYNGKFRKVSSFLIPVVKEGNIVRIHYFHAIEIII